MQFLYGQGETYIDVTEEVLRFCCDGERIRVPADDDARGQVFTDPLRGMVKEIVLVDGSDRTVYPDGKAIDIALTDEQIRTYPKPHPFHWSGGRPAAEQLEETIEEIHTRLHFCGGSLTDEGPEQAMVLRYLDPDSKVLEIGANIGHNTLMIASVLADSANLVTLECNPVAAQVLACNRQANGFRFGIEPSALSSRRLIQSGWDTKPADEIEPGWTGVATLTLPDLRAKYPIPFDTLVADCEGALFYILSDTPELLDGIGTVIMEADYRDVEHKRYVESVFTARGLRRIHSEPLVTDWAHPFPEEIAASFFEVWTKRLRSATVSSFLELGQKHGTDKVSQHGYQFFYPRFLEPLREQEFTMLEIGYHEGASARMWEEYFPHARIFAMDIDKSGDFGHHQVIKGDQSNFDDLQRVAATVGPCKLIIDDGSHHPVHQFETFNYLFGNLLEPGGVYIIEDVECNYWHPGSSVYGYRIGFFSAIEASTKLIDLVNAEFSGRNNSVGISTVSYGQNCIIITKQTAEERFHFDRGYQFQGFINGPAAG